MSCCAKCTGMVVNHLSAPPGGIPRIAGQFAAAFRAFGQDGAIPPAAESLNQRHCVHHSAAENIYRSDFGRERRTLSGGHLEVAGDAALVTRDSELQVFLGCSDGSFLRLSFVLEDPQCRYVVLNLLKTRQHGLAIIGDSLIVSSDGLV